LRLTRLVTDPSFSFNFITNVPLQEKQARVRQVPMQAMSAIEKLRKRMHVWSRDQRVRVSYLQMQR